MDSKEADCDGTTLEVGTRVDERGRTASVDTLEAISDLGVVKEGLINEGRTSEMADKGVAAEVGKRVDNQRSKEGLSEPAEQEGADKGAGRVGKTDS